MRHYKQLTQEQRYCIYTLQKAELNQTEIARALGVHKSTISRELHRNRGQRGYRPQQAHRVAQDRQRNHVHHRITSDIWDMVELFIEQDWSPEEVSGWLYTTQQASISHEWIYQYILKDKQHGGTLYTHLRCKTRYRKRYGAKDRRGQIKNRVSIDERPAIVDKRKRIGDWEVDTIIGTKHKQALVSLTERKSGFTLIQKVTHRTKEAVAEAVQQLLKSTQMVVHTITADNLSGQDGKEFADHEVIAGSLNCGFYFAHPYSSWERGTNENTNGLIRQYFPKGRGFNTTTDQEVHRAMVRLNHRPRKRLDFKTPIQVLFNKPIPVALTT